MNGHAAVQIPDGLEPSKLAVHEGSTTSSLMVNRGRWGGSAKQKTDKGTKVPCRRSLL